jgi:DNA-binding MarR family transcriptional regulator
MHDPLDLKNIPPGTSKVALAVYRLSRLLRGQLADVLDRNSDFGLVAWRVCLGLSQHDALAQKDLVEFIAMEQGQVSRSLAVMEERGLIRSERSPQDGRVRLLSLTDAGRAQFNRIAPAVAAFYRSIDQTLSAMEQSQFLEMARRIADANDELEKRTGTA